MSEQWFTVRVEDSGDGLLINEDDAKRFGLKSDTAYAGYFLPDGKYRLRRAPSPSPAPGVEGKNRAQGMVRSMDQWRNMVPLAVMSGSMAQIEYALVDAKHDIEMLWCALASLSQPAKGEREGGE